MSQLLLTCFGDFQVALADEPLTSFQSKTRALLAYLAIERQSHPRSDLAQLFWPGYAEESARNSLRQALHQLRQRLHDLDGDSPWLLQTRQTVQFNPAAPILVDVTTFTGLIAACAAHAHDQLATCQPCLARLRQAVDLYQGDFLAGFTLTDSEPFAEWQRITQERLHLQTIDALTQLATGAESVGDDEGALQAARRQLALEPRLEAAHRQVMRSLARRGQRPAAVAQYQLCCQVLASELGVAPAAQTTALYEQIRAGELDSITPRAWQATDALQAVWQDDKVKEGPVAPIVQALSPLHDWGEIPAVDFFAGRAAEVAQLTTWLAPIPQSGMAPARLVSILGLGGIGKTTLAAAVTKAVAPAFTVVIWRSLLNAPPLGELLRNWLQILARQTLTTLPESLDEQMQLLLAYLRRERCLLVLDNVESILAADDQPVRVSESSAEISERLRARRAPERWDPSGDERSVGLPPRHLTSSRAGATRPGYEGYDGLLQRLGSSDHQSCLLLTSREQPYTLVRLGRQAQGSTGRIRVLALTGLDLQAGHTLLESNGLYTSAQEAARLIENYSGNPLALQIAAATIADFFGGDVAAFQQEAGGLFDGIRMVLDQQFARLSSLEREILIWLAIEREAVTVQTLHSNLLHAIPMRDLLEALQALQNRSLLEKRDSGLTLQNVIIEYTTEYLVEQVYGEISDDRGIRRSASRLPVRREPWQDDKVKMGSAHPVIPSSSHLVTLSFLDRFALLKAQAKEYVRQSQARLILQPLAERLVTKFGSVQTIAILQAMLAHLQQQTLPPGYAAGNLINLLLQLGTDLRGYDCSGLAVWQAYLREATLYDVNFSNADLTGSNFTKPFNFIWSAAYSPDGQTIAGGSLEGTIFLWQTSDGQAIQIYQGHTALVYTLAFSPDGKLLASGSEDKTICVWDRQSGQLRYQLDEQTGFVNSVAFSPDSTLLVSGSDDCTVRVWDAATGRGLQRLEGHRARVMSVAFHPTGGLLASGGDDGLVQLWDLATGRALRSWTLTEPIYTVAFHPAGAFLISGGKDALLRYWSIETGENYRTLHGHKGDVWVVVPSRDGTLLASSGDTTVHLWDAQRGDCVRIIYAHQKAVTALAFSPDGKTVATSSQDRTLCLWDVQTGQLLQIFNGYNSMVGALAFQNTGELLAATLVNEQVRIWDVRTGYPRHLLRGHSKSVQAIAFHPQQPSFVSCGDDAQAYVWDLQSGRQRWLCRGPQHNLTMIAINHAGARVAGYAKGGDVWIWATPPSNSSSATLGVATAPLHRRIQCPAQRIFAFAFSPDDALLAGGSNAGIYLWRVESGELVRILPGQTLDNVSLAFSPDGKLLASGNIDHTVALWSVATGELRHLLRNHHGTIYALAFSPDGKLLASASGDHRVSLWEVQTGKLLHTYIGHQSRVFAVAFHPNGQQIASGSFDGVVKYWDVQNGACVETFYAKGPYAGMNITGVTGISEAQKAALIALGAVEG